MSEPSEIELEWEEWDGRSPFIHHCIAGSIAGLAEHTLLYPFDTVKTHMQAYCSTCPNNPANQSVWGDQVASSGGRGAPSLGGGGDGTMWSTMRRLIKYGHNNGNMILPTSALDTNMHAPTATAAQPSSNKSTTLRRLVTNISPSAGTPSAPIMEEVGFLRLWRGVQSMALGSAPAHALYFSSYEFVKSIFLSYQQKEAGPQSQSHNATLGPIGASAAGFCATLLHDGIMCPMDTIKQRMQSFLF